MALPTATTPIAKSLHTLTVLQQVASLHMAADGGAEPVARADRAIAAALETLGLSGRPDPYGLAAKALGLLLKAQA
jgi:hypothetical protein